VQVFAFGMMDPVNCMVWYPQVTKVIKSLHQAADKIGFDACTGLHSTASVDKANTKGNLCNHLSNL